MCAADRLAMRTDDKCIYVMISINNIKWQVVDSSCHFNLCAAVFVIHIVVLIVFAVVDEVNPNIIVNMKIVFQQLN